MRRAVGHRDRPGYILLITIAALALLVIVAVVLGRYAAIDIRRENVAMLEAAGEQALQSARSWSRVHADELVETQTVTLSLDECIRPGVAGSAELSRHPDAGGVVRIDCRLRLHRGRLRLVRQVSWPTAGPTTRSLAADSATP